MKRTRRTVALVLSTIFTLGFSFVIGSTMKRDPQLVLAEKYVEQLFSYEAVSKDKTEKEQKEDPEKLESLNKTIKAYDLMGLDGEADYVLVTRGVNGYAVFQKEDLELIEFSQYNTSPFGNLSDNPYVYYGGPTNYYRKKGEQVENIHTGKAFDKEVAAQIAPKLQTKIQQDKAERLERQEQERLQKEEQAIEAASAKKSDLMINALSSGAGNSSEIIIGDPGPTGGDEIDADELTIVSRQYITDKDYFLQMEEHAYNADGTCITVAATLLLGYLNWAKDGRLITEDEFLFQDETKTRADWLETPYAHETMSPTYIPQPASTETLMNQSKISSGEIIEYRDSEEPTITLVDQTGTFYGKMLEYIDPDGSWATALDLRLGILAYFVNHVDSNVRDQMTMAYYSNDEEAKQEIVDTIADDYPVIANIDTFKLKDGVYQTIGHAVVVYGTQTINYNGQILDGFIAHYGWQAGSTHYWVNEAWIKDCLTLTTSHVHSGEEPYRGNSHVVRCAVCGRTRTTSAHTYQNFEQIWTDLVDPYYHLETCSCALQRKSYHRYEYTYLDNYQHEKSCIDCGYFNNEDHMLKPNGTYCMLCGTLIL